MKPQEVKLEYVRLRAEGKSFRTIAKTLHISTSTCSEWEEELKDQIAALKKEQLDELYETYLMGKAARIRRLGDTLRGIEAALAQAELESMAPEKLLDYKLKYSEALKSEYTDPEQAYIFKGKVNPEDIVEALGDLHNRVRAGEVSTEQAQKEAQVLGSLIRAYDLVKIQPKLEALESILAGR